MHPFEAIVGVLVLAGALSLIRNRTARERWALAFIALLVVLGLLCTAVDRR